MPCLLRDHCHVYESIVVLVGLSWLVGWIGWMDGWLDGWLLRWLVASLKVYSDTHTLTHKHERTKVQVNPNQSN